VKIPDADVAEEHIIRWADNRRQWQRPKLSVVAAHLGVCEDFKIEIEELEKLLSSQERGTLMRCMIEDFLTCRFGKERRNLIEDYLKQHGWRESIAGREYLGALRASTVSLYEVVAVDRGRGLWLRDLIKGGEPVEVDEQVGSLNMERWDRVALRIVEYRGRKCLSGSVLMFPPQAAEELLSEMRAGPDAASATGSEQPAAEDLYPSDNYTWLFTNVWLDHRLRAILGPLPELINADREKIVLCKVRFLVEQAHRDEVVRRLDKTLSLRRQSKSTEQPGWVWFRRKRAEKAKRAGGGAAAQPPRADDKVVIQGLVELRERYLTLEANSVKRAQRGATMLKRRLGSLVGRPITSSQSVKSAMAEQAGRTQTSPQPGPAAGVPPEDLAEALREFKDRHYRSILDEPVPMVGDVSPREAVLTEEGRERVTEWLKYLENSETRRARVEGERPYDFAWMWQELGISERRH
jgi:hypothetical protein